MNEQWRQPEREAHEAKAEALAHAANTLRGLDGLLDPIEGSMVENTVAMLDRAREKHERAAALARVA